MLFELTTFLKKITENDRKILEGSVNQFLLTCSRLESEFMVKNGGISTNSSILHSTFNHILAVWFGRSLLLKFLYEVRQNEALDLPKYVRMLKRFDSDLWSNENRNQNEATVKAMLLKTSESDQEIPFFDRIDVDNEERNEFDPIGTFNGDSNSNAADNKWQHFFFTKCLFFIFTLDFDVLKILKLLYFGGKITQRF